MVNIRSGPVKVEYNPRRISIQCMLVSLYFAVMPLSGITFFAGFSILKLITIPIAGYCLAALFIGNVAIDLNSVHLFYTVYMLYTISGTLLLFNEEAYISLRGYIELFIIMLLFSIRLYTPKERRLMENAVLVSGIIVVFFSLVSTDVMDEGRRTMRMFGAYFDPNELCGMVLLPLTISLQRLFESQKKFGYAVLSFLMLYVTFATGSRGGLIAVAITCVAFVAVALRNPKSKVIAILCILLVVAIFVFIVYPLLPQGMQDRFSVDRVDEDKGSGRFVLWEALIRSSLSRQEYVMWGQGINSTALKLTGEGFKNNVAHNEYVQVFHDQGIVGVLLFLTLEVGCILRNIRSRSYLSAAMVGMMALSMSLTFDPAVKVFWNTIMLCAFTFGDSKEYTE